MFKVLLTVLLAFAIYSQGVHIKWRSQPCSVFIFSNCLIRDILNYFEYINNQLKTFQFQSHCHYKFNILSRRVGIGTANVLVVCLAELRPKLQVLPVRSVLRMLFLKSMPIAVLPRRTCGHNQRHHFDYKLVAFHARVRTLFDNVGQIGMEQGEI